jgi:hypothetical protein
MSNGTIVVAQLEVDGCIAELYLNGIPLIRLAPPKIPIQNRAVEQFLVPGENTLEVLVEPGSRPLLARIEERRIPFRPMRATGRLIRFPEGVPGTVEHGDLLAEANFSWSQASLAQQVFPRSARTGFDMGAAHGYFVWQAAPEIVLDPATIEEARAVLDQVEAAIRAHDIDWLLRLNQVMVRDTIRSYSAMDDGFLRREITNLMRRQQKVLDPVIPRDPHTHDFRVVAGGRILQCIDVDWTSSFKLRSPTGGAPLPYMLFLARIDGKLQIVR